jgi:hypothetical protein
MNNDGCCSCGCGCCEPPKKQVRIDFLYLDLDTCDRCRGAEAALDAAVSGVTPALLSAGYRIEVQKTLIDTREKAVQHRFLSSPTIRVNGRDIAATLKETKCECCGDICGEDVDCRVWEYEGTEYAAPPKELIAAGILRAAFSDAPPDEAPYTLPENLERFFRGKDAGAGASQP